MGETIIVINDTGLSRALHITHAESVQSTRQIRTAADGADSIFP